MAFEIVTIKYADRYFDPRLATLDIGNLENPTDQEVRTAVGLHIQAALNLQVPPDLTEYQVDRGEEQAVISLRPATTHG